MSEPTNAGSEAPLQVDLSPSMTGPFGFGRIPVANGIAIVAGARALWAYVRTLCGEPPRWDKTHHDAHPAEAVTESAS